MFAGDLRGAIPAAPPRSTDLLPGLRLARALRSGTLPLAFVGLFALFPLVMFSMDRGFALSMRRTRTVTGRVVQAAPDRESLREDVRVGYEFSTPDGVTYRGTDCVKSKSPYATLQPGDAVPIVHLAGNAATNAIAGGCAMANAPPWPIFLVFPAMMLLFMGPLFWPTISQLVRDRRLFRTGIVLPGTVVFVNARAQGMSWPGWPTATRSEVFVKVRLPTGGEREVRAFCDNDWLLAHLPPGAEVTVACHPTAPKAMLVENYVR